MSFTNDLAQGGYDPLQDNDENHRYRDDRLDLRTLRPAVRISDRDQFGGYIYEEGTAGDIICAVFWEEESRVIPGWSWAWPAITIRDEVITTDFGSNQGFVTTPEGKKSDEGVVTTDTDKQPDFVLTGPNVGSQDDSGQQTGVIPQGAPESGAGNTKKCGDLGPAGILPLKFEEDGFIPDNRFKRKIEDEFPDHPRNPGGMKVIVTNSTEEFSQHEIIHPTDRRHVSVTQGDERCADLLVDIGIDGNIDTSRMARYHTGFRVVVAEDGDGAASYAKNNPFISLEYGETSCEKTAGYGHISITDGDTPVHAAMSRLVSGPIHLGHPTADKHVIGKTIDGENINAAHIDVNAYFFANSVFDGPLEFQQDIYSNPPALPYKLKVDMKFDPGLGHSFVDG